MSPQPWHGLSHTRAWGQVGDSYSLLAHSDRQASQGNELRPAATPLKNVLPAGSVSTAKPKGAGSFQLQESQARRGNFTSFPTETYPSDFKTLKMIDFDPVRLKHCKVPARAQRPSDSGIMLGTTSSAPIAPSMPHVASSISQARVPLLDGTLRETSGITVPAYNIINGESCQHVDKEKYWRGNCMDYRRRR